MQSIHKSISDVLSKLDSVSGIISQGYSPLDSGYSQIYHSRIIQFIKRTRSSKKL